MLTILYPYDFINKALNLFSRVLSDYIFTLLRTLEDFNH
jgi:hypothetical protein